MKKLVLAAVLATASSAVLADGFGGHHFGGLSGFAGSVSGTVEVNTSGMSVAASQVMGNGFSFQKAEGYSGGDGWVGGEIDRDGLTVFTDSSHWADTKAFGFTHGNAPAMSGDLIANGAASFGQTELNIAGYGTFHMGVIGGIPALAGIGAITSH